MMEETTFKRLIQMSESTIVDFKKQMYDFHDDKDLTKTSEFIKDIISLVNTIRNETAFIIIGIEEKKDGVKIFHGLDKFIDDSFLQDKIKDKVYPRPFFCFYTIEYEKNKYGIIEIPLIKYPSPIIPIKNMKGLEKGCIYYRHGTTNCEANGLENIKINDWFRYMLSNNVEESLSEELGLLLKKVTTDKIKLSETISDALLLSRKYNLNNLEEFCTIEIKGIEKDSYENFEKIFKYRILSIMMSPCEIKINPFSRATPFSIKNEMRESEDFKEFKYFFNQPISKIESYIETISNKSENKIMMLKTGSRKLFPETNAEEYPITIYIFEDDLRSLYLNIKQKLIDILIKL